VLSRNREEARTGNFLPQIVSRVVPIIMSTFEGRFFDVPETLGHLGDSILSVSTVLRHSTRAGDECPGTLKILECKCNSPVLCHI
jgi:hypothetical protein